MKRIIRVDNCGNCPYLSTAEIPYDTVDNTMALRYHSKMKIRYWCRLARQEIGEKNINE